MRLIHLLILANYHMIGRVQVASQLEGAPTSIDWLLHELNGAHLRLSIAVVHNNNETKILYLSFKTLYFW